MTAHKKKKKQMKNIQISAENILRKKSLIITFMMLFAALERVANFGHKVHNECA